MAIMVECYLRLGLNDLADTSLALLQENYPEHPAFDRNGEFTVRTDVTNPSLLYTVTFGLLGDNRGNPPLAPTQRPRNSGSQEIINSQTAPVTKRSWFDILTFGIFS
jgi:outer membrane protein assembly factor BamD